MRSHFRPSLRAALLLPLLALMISAPGCSQDTRPTQQDPGLIQLSADLGNEFVPAGELSDVVARVRINAAELEASTRRPLNIGLAIDTSGSMRGQPMRDARDAALALVDSLVPGDRLAVVTFDSTANTVFPSTELDQSDIADVREKLSTIEARGTTDMRDGLAQILEQTIHHTSEEVTSRIVLLGDGVPNDKNLITNYAQQAGARGVPISALGLGLDYDEVLMGEIAQLSGGSFHYVEDSAAVVAAFRDEVLRLERLVARNTQLVLRGGPGIEIVSIMGQAQTPANAASVTLGDIAEGESRDVVVQLRSPGRRAGATVEILDAVLSFQDATDEQGSQYERTEFLGAAATMDDAEIAAGVNEEVMRAAENVDAAAATVQAIRMIRNNDYAQAAALLDDASRGYAASGDDDAAASVQMLREAVPSAPPEAMGPEAMGPEEVVSEEAEAAPRDYERRLRRAHDVSLDAMGF